jgi:hypothetical protein
MIKKIVELNIFDEQLHLWLQSIIIKWILIRNWLKSTIIDNKNSLLTKIKLNSLTVTFVAYKSLID